MTDGGRIPGPIVIPNCAQVNLVWSLPNTKVVRNSLHGSFGGGFTPSATIAEAIRAAIVASAAWTAWKAYVNSAAAFAAVELRSLNTANLALFTSTGGSTAGTGATGALPGGVSIVVTERTAQAGRAFRGRVYLAGLDSAAMAAGGVIAAAAMTAAANFITEVQTAMTASGLTLCIGQPARQQYTGETNAIHPARAAATPAVTSILVRDNIFDSQRRRVQL